MVDINLDLYDYFVHRFAGYNILKDFPDSPTVLNTNSKRDVFYGLFRIILGCDAAHDFMTDRGGFDKNDKELFVNAMSESVYLDLESINPGLSAVCEKIINYGKHKISGSNTYFGSDTLAKGTVNKILLYLGLSLISAGEIGYGDCTGDYTISRMVKLINFENRSTQQPQGNTFELRVDATQNTLDMLPIYSAILDETRLRNSGCQSAYNLILREDVTSVYDAANDDKLQKVLKQNDFSVTNVVDTYFNIRCGGHNVIQCKLVVQGEKKINLQLIKYFTQDINISVSNDKNGQDSNNSVKGIVKLIQKNINNIKEENIKNFAIQNGIIDKPKYIDSIPNYVKEVPDAIKKKIIFKYSIAKTMGDFLQIASYLNVSRIDKMFISADILSTKICALFSKASFVEKLKTPEYIIDGMGVYMTDTERKRHLTASTLLQLSGSKRQRESRTVFGVSKLNSMSNKLNSMSNEELKTKLKSIGLSVTKLNSRGKRVHLTRKEMEKKAGLFKNLQRRAKKMNLKLMYKSKKGGYKYKGYTRLMNELKMKMKMKMKMKTKVKTKTSVKFG